MTVDFHDDDWLAHEKRARVLVGVDGSADGLRATRFGARIVQREGGVLHLVHAVDDAFLTDAWGVSYDPTALRDAGEYATRQAVAAAQAVGVPNNRIHAEVILGSARGVLSRYSEGAKLLVVGRRSVSGLERMFIGSTSLAVVGDAQCPVLVVSAAAHPEEAEEKGRITVGLDARPHAAATLAWAMGEADRRGAALTVVHVAAPVVADVIGGEVPDTARTQIESLLAPLRERYPAVSTEVHVLTGEPVHELADLSATSDLLVLGAHKPNFLGVQLGTLMRALLAHAECPVLLVK